MLRLSTGPVVGLRTTREPVCLMVLMVVIIFVIRIDMDEWLYITFLVRAAVLNGA